MFVTTWQYHSRVPGSINVPGRVTDRQPGSIKSLCHSRVAGDLSVDLGEYLGYRHNRRGCRGAFQRL